MFSAFGVIKSCFLAGVGVPGRHKGYGYLEYETLQSAQVASMDQTCMLTGYFLYILATPLTQDDTICCLKSIHLYKMYSLPLP